jgi:membrane protease subunit HflK
MQMSSQQNAGTPVDGAASTPASSQTLPTLPPVQSNDARTRDSSRSRERDVR